MNGFTYCSPDVGLDILVEQGLQAAYGTLDFFPESSPFVEPLYHAGQPLGCAELPAVKVPAAGLFTVSLLLLCMGWCQLDQPEASRLQLFLNNQLRSSTSAAPRA